MPNDGGKTVRQGRSPAYPFISLRKTLERAEQFRKMEGRHAAPPTSAFRAWKLSEKGNTARQTTAALKYYGLMEYVGRGAERQVKLTDRAAKILLDKRPESSERDQLIREAALTPTIFSEMWREWGFDLPSDATIQTFLLLKQGFSESAVPDVIAVYKDTLSLAKLDQPDNMSGYGDDLGDKEGGRPEVGDLVQWESNGQLAFEKPRRVRAVQEHEGIEWVFVEGSETGMPMEEMIVEQRAKDAEGGGAGSVAPPKLLEEPVLPTIGIRKEITSLDEGDAVLVWPETISSDSYYDLKAWLDGILAKARRRTGISEKDE